MREGKISTRTRIKIPTAMAITYVFETWMSRRIKEDITGVSQEVLAVLGTCSRAY